MTQFNDESTWHIVWNASFEIDGIRNGEVTL